MFERSRPSTEVTAFPTTDLCSTIAEDDDDPEAAESAPSTVSSTLSPSLLRDLRRFAEPGADLDLLPAVAACVRHARSLAMQLDLDGATINLSINPHQQVFRADLDLCALAPAQLAALRLVHVEPDASADKRGPRRVGPLRPLLWLLAMHGSRTGLLPEIDGNVRYRMALGMSLNGLPVDPALAPTLLRLRAAPAPLAELQLGSALSDETTRRLLNALYLQSGLMLTRAFPTRAR